MYRDKKVVVVMPAYNAAKTLPKTYAEVLDQGIVDKIILVDDRSRDNTVEIARSLPGVQVHQHEKNTGYGGNQKTCYRLALEAGADIVIMIHPDYQYTPKLIPAMASMIANGLHPCVLGSRILGGYSLQGGMPVWKYVANRFLTLAENILLGAKLSEYHTGYRAFSREILEKLDLTQQLRRFRFRQPNARANLLARIHDRRSQLPDEIFQGSLLHQFAAKHQIRLRLPGNGTGLPAGKNGDSAVRNCSRPQPQIIAATQLERR